MEKTCRSKQKQLIWKGTDDFYGVKGFSNISNQKI